MELFQRKKVRSVAEKMKARGCNVSNNLPSLWKGSKSWVYLILIVVTVGKHSSEMDRHTTEGS
eukprot:6311916-Ditylum_brightwellii.AAC.1